MFTGGLKDLERPIAFVDIRDDEFKVKDKERVAYVNLDVRRCWLQNLGLKNWTVQGGQLIQSHLIDCYMPNAAFTRVNFTGTVFRNCNLKAATFEDCTLEYVQFHGCQLNYSSILKSLPRDKNNLRWGALRNLRVNAQQDGDFEWATSLLLMEQAASRQHELDTLLGRGDYYKRKQAYERIAASWRWLLAQLQRVTWAYGLRPGLLLGNGVVVVLLFTLLYWLIAPGFRVAPTGSARELSFGEAAYVSAVTFCTVGAPDFSPVSSTARILQAAEGAAGAVFIGLLAASAFRRMAR